MLGLLELMNEGHIIKWEMENFRTVLLDGGVIF
jgi:hypothetical protein